MHHYIFVVRRRNAKPLLFSRLALTHYIFVVRRTNGFFLLFSPLVKFQSKFVVKFGFAELVVSIQISSKPLYCEPVSIQMCSGKTMHSRGLELSANKILEIQIENPDSENAPGRYKFVLKRPKSPKIAAELICTSKVRSTLCQYKYRHRQ